jgi:hypothetical protein
MMTQMYFGNVGQELMSMATTEHGSAGRMPTSVEKVTVEDLFINFVIPVVHSKHEVSNLCIPPRCATKMFLVVPEE